MSDTYPPADGQQPQPGAEYLEAGGGSPLTPTTDPQPGTGGRKRGLVIGASVAALAVVGVGAWAATSFFSTGAQPAEALPSTTIGYASIDLDPSGGQKIEAVKTLNKFPAFKDKLGLNTDDDILEKLVGELDDTCGLDYADDIKPWLGMRMAVAAVDTGAESPTRVVVVQVKDTKKADAAFTTLRDCDETGTEGEGGWVFDGDWAIVAENQKQAQAVADATDKGTLADDQDFKDLTAAAGDPGIVNLYAAPEAGKYFADMATGMSGLADGLDQGFGGDLGSFSSGSASGSGNAQGTAFVGDDGTNAIADALKNFKGLAITVRFDSGALEVESAGDTGLNISALYSSDRGADVVQTLPADTAAAIGIGFEPGWLSQLVNQMAAFSGGEMSAADLLQSASEATGMDLPSDGETLLGQSAAFSVGSDIDPETIFNSLDSSNIPVALKVQGDPGKIKAVLAKIVAANGQEPDAGSILGNDSDGDTIVIGPDADYRGQVLERGTLGSSAVFKDVVREADKASAVLFVNFDAGDWLVKLAGDDASVAENLKPLAGFGITGWKDDDYAHSVLRITTD